MTPGQGTLGAVALHFRYAAPPSSSGALLVADATPERIAAAGARLAAAIPPERLRHIEWACVPGGGTLDAFPQAWDRPAPEVET